MRAKVVEETTTKVIEAADPITVTKWTNWVSPTLTSSTSYGAITGTLPYQWFNGSAGAGNTATNNTTYITYWQFPEPIKLANVYWFSKSNPDRYGTNCTMNFYSVDGNNIETSIGSASYSYSNAGSNGSHALDDMVEVTKLKITTYGNWPNANGSWYLPISFDGYVERTRTYTPHYAVRS